MDFLKEVLRHTNSITTPFFKRIIYPAYSVPEVFSWYSWIRFKSVVPSSSFSTSESVPGKGAKMHYIQYITHFVSIQRMCAPALRKALRLDATEGLQRPLECSDYLGRWGVSTGGCDGRHGVIAAATEMCIICRVQGENSHLCLGFMEEVAFRLGLEGWAGVHFATRMNRQ